jgi:hypothetical protein
MKTFFLAAALGGLTVLGACRTDNHTTHSSEVGQARINVEASNTNIMAGETVTFMARTADTYGRNAKVKWTSTAGDLKIDDDGRVARVTFKESGTYSVKGSLWVDNREIETDTVEVRVRPVS